MTGGYGVQDQITQGISARERFNLKFVQWANHVITVCLDMAINFEADTRQVTVACHVQLLVFHQFMFKIIKEFRDQNPPWAGFDLGEGRGCRVAEGPAGKSY